MGVNAGRGRQKTRDASQRWRREGVARLPRPVDIPLGRREASATSRFEVGIWFETCRIFQRGPSAAGFLKRACQRFSRSSEIASRCAHCGLAQRRLVVKMATLVPFILSAFTLYIPYEICT